MAIPKPPVTRGAGLKPNGLPNVVNKGRKVAGLGKRAQAPLPVMHSAPASGNPFAAFP